MELRFPPESAPYLDALALRLSLWTEEAAAPPVAGDAAADSPVLLPTEVPPSEQWCEVGRARLTVRAARSPAGTLARVALSPPSDVSPSSSRPASPPAGAPPRPVSPGPDSDAGLAPRLSLSYSLVGEGQSARVLTRPAPASERPGVPIAVADGPACLAALLTSGATTDGGDLLDATPLHKAAANDNQCSAALLLRAGASVERGNRFGDRALHRAAENGRINTGRLLLEHGAEV